MTRNQFSSFKFVGIRKASDVLCDGGYITTYGTKNFGIILYNENGSIAGRVTGKQFETLQTSLTLYCEISGSGFGCDRHYIRNVWF